MHLVLLPLTYKGTEKKQEAIKTCVELARTISDKELETFALAGILTFTDKVISKETRQHIKEVLGMTQVGKMLMDEGRIEGREEGREEGIRAIILDNLEENIPKEKILIKLQKRFNLTEEQSEQYYQRFGL